MRSNMIVTYTILCSLAIITSGCSSMFGGKKEEPKPVIVNNVPNTPEWFYEREEDESKYITITATDVSKDMQFAIDKATYNAKLQIAARLRSDVQAIVRETSLESGYGVKDVEREIDRVSKIVTNQTIGFFKRENIAVVFDKDHYRAFVKFRISIEDARRLTQKVDHKAREDKFKELENEVEVIKVQ